MALTTGSQMRQGAFLPDLARPRMGGLFFAARGEAPPDFRFDAILPIPCSVEPATGSFDRALDHLP